MEDLVGSILLTRFSPLLQLGNNGYEGVEADRPGRPECACTLERWTARRYRFSVKLP